MTSNRITSGTTSIPYHIRDALAPLLLASQYSYQLESDLWEFAVEIDQLATLGLAPNDFRWLVRSGLVSHQREVTLEDENGRQFQPTGDLTYCERSCFVLTDVGIQLAETLHQETNGVLPVGSLSTFERCSSNGYVPIVGTQETHVPTWDSERRELRFNGVIIKHYRWVAANQQAVLDAFEEDGWPPRIDDPLPPHEEQDPKRRLADTIKCLNRKQCHAVVHFRGDGTGEGVIWEQVATAESDQ